MSDSRVAAIASGTDLNAVNKSGDTALHAAALLGYDRVIQQLADAGVKPGILNTGATYDLSEIKWSIQRRNADGSVVQLGIESGNLKVTFKSGQVTSSNPVPGIAAG